MVQRLSHLAARTEPLRDTQAQRAQFAFFAAREICSPDLVLAEVVVPPIILKLLLLVSVPEGVVTTTGPLVAPLGTTAVKYVSETTRNVLATPLKVTLVVPVNA
jgi:hypothetical protein